MTRRRRRPDRGGDQTRERLFRDGTRALSDAELLEILLRNGCPGSTTKQLARELLAEYGSLIGLSNVERGFLHRYGIGKAKAATIIAAFEIARRVAKERIPRRDLLDRPDSVASYLGLRYALSDQETMGALFLDVRNRLIGESEVYRGTLSRAAVEPRAIMKEALMRSASGFILFHTHPSGDPTPSGEDPDLLTYPC
jgi:DNA repair protein RadC